MKPTREQTYWLLCGIRWEHMDATFENFDVTQEDAKAARDAMVSFVDEGIGTFAVLSGEYGTGKSHLAAAALKANGGGLFITNGEILTLYRSLPFRDDKELQKDECIDRLKKVQFLVIDELGTSGGGVDENSLFDEVISYRADRQLPTVFTSNAGLDKVEQFLGGRLMDRVRRAAVIVPSVKGSKRTPTRSRRAEGIPHYEVTLKLPMVEDYFFPIGWEEFMREKYNEEGEDAESHWKMFNLGGREFREWLRANGREEKWPVRRHPTPTSSGRMFLTGSL